MENNKRSHLQFKNQVITIFGKEYSLIGKYKNSKTPIEIKHNVCGIKFMASPDRMINRGQGCPTCGKQKSAKVRSKSTSQFKKDVRLTLGDDYEVLGNYENNKKKILMKHNVCGYEYEAIPVNILKGNKCPKCAGLVKKTTYQFIEEIHNLVGSEYSVVGDYSGADSKILFKHNNCGFEYKVTPSWFLRGSRCPKCGGTLKKTTEKFKAEISDLVGTEYSLIGEYESTHKKIKIKHNLCNREYNVSPTRFLAGDRCPFCKESKAEKIIEDFLKKNNIVFEREHGFPDLKDKSKLSFDFFLKERSIAIEYDGEFHYLPIYGTERLNQQRRRDRIKDNYSKSNKIKLIRIPYWDFDKIEDIINTEIIFR